MSLAYNIAVTIFGGFGPFIIAWLISVTGSKAAPSLSGAVAERRERRAANTRP